MRTPAVIRPARLVLALCALLLLGGCASHVTGSTFRPEVYIVRSGDTLYAIAYRYNIDYHDLARWNGIANPRDIHPGRLLWLRPGHATSRQKSAAVKHRDKSASSKHHQARQPAPKQARGPAKAPGQWRWPAQGRVIGTFSDGVAAGRGIDIAGRKGEPIHATAGGEVVYSGNGLKAYGNLLIIRHTDDFLSAYAHNSRLLVDEGDQVKAGQTIARMGETSHGKALLHFEIRRRGDPVDPRKYLPDR